jgi:hypothetical protein
MQAKNYPTDVLDQANSILAAMAQIDIEISFGNVNHSMLLADVNQVTPVLSQIMALETQLTDLRNQRDSLNQAMWDKIKRIRMGVKAHYGDDSSQYEMVGGTRLSDRKTRTHKAPTAA